MFPEYVNGFPKLCPIMRLFSDVNYVHWLNKGWETHYVVTTLNILQYRLTMLKSGIVGNKNYCIFEKNQALLLPERNIFLYWCSIDSAVYC